MIEEQIKEEQIAFSGADWFSYNPEKILVVGAGGTGSWASLLLSRLGYDIALVDFDLIQKRNLAGQFFKNKQLGSLKVESVRNNVSEYCHKFFNIYNSDYKSFMGRMGQMKFEAVFSCVDNMTTRREIFESLKHKIIKASILIDIRLDMEFMQIYFVTEENYEDYEKTLFSDDKIPDAPCTLKQTTHNAVLSVSIAINQLLNYFANVTSIANSKRAVRNVDFLTEYYTPLNAFTITNNH
jgi:molybdopterin/thiamine biosynthesis adenylyltransferase